MSSHSFRDAIRDPEVASIASVTDELRAFKASHPLLYLGLFGAGEIPELQGDLEFGVKNYGGNIQVTLRIPQADEFAYLEVSPCVPFWDFLEASLSDGTLRWQKPRPKEKRKS